MSKLAIAALLACYTHIALAATSMASTMAGTKALWALAILLGTATVALAIHRTKARRRLDAIAAAFAASTDATELPPRGEPLLAIANAMERMRATLATLDAQLNHEAALHAHAENQLRELSDRYGLAIRGADDAIWEWDLKQDRAHFSERWKNLLGYSEHELSDRMEEWWLRIHPEDYDATMSAFDAHIEGRSPRISTEHRLRRRDGTWCCVLARAALVRDAQGLPQRLVGLASDISNRKRVQEALVEIAQALAPLSGEECMRNLVKNFAAVLGVREAFVCECSDQQPTTRVRMLARWKAGSFANCVEFDLAQTACEEVILGGRTVFQPRDADQRWPLEAKYERSSYLGIPCLDSGGRVIGHIACADDQPMREDLPHQAILKIFALRAAVEIERGALEREIASAQGDG
ncbi:MAG: PAS domain-containing protein [Betaproteobacteria bacterium]